MLCELPCEGKAWNQPGEHLLKLAPVKMLAAAKTDKDMMKKNSVNSSFDSRKIVIVIPELKHTFNTRILNIKYKILQNRHRIQYILTYITLY